MGKRSTFPRRKQDAYDTPKEALAPLLPWLNPGTRFCEPCAGNGSLLDALVRNGHRRVAAYDVAPRRGDIGQADALESWVRGIDCYITNPPWTRGILHKLIMRLATFAPTWLLFDADWKHTKQARPYLNLCWSIVSVGRVSWMRNGTSGKDNCAWCLFDANERPTDHPVFINEEAA